LLQLEIDFPGVYQGHNKNIAQQMVMQSENFLQGKDKKLCIAGDDVNTLVSFYQDTMGKGVPLAVNCKDGIDRTGMMMVGLQMLHEHNQGNDDLIPTTWTPMLCVEI